MTDDEAVAKALLFVEEGLRRMFAREGGTKTVEGFVAGEVAFVISRAEAAAISPVPNMVRTDLGGAN